jgi:hypothetical protein
MPTGKQVKDTGSKLVKQLEDALSKDDKQAVLSLAKKFEATYKSGKLKMSMSEESAEKFEAMLHEAGHPAVWGSADDVPMPPEQTLAKALDDAPTAPGEAPKAAAKVESEFDGASVKGSDLFKALGVGGGTAAAGMGLSAYGDEKKPSRPRTLEDSLAGLDTKPSGMIEHKAPAKTDWMSASTKKRRLDGSVIPTASSSDAVPETASLKMGEGAKEFFKDAPAEDPATKELVGPPAAPQDTPLPAKGSSDYDKFSDALALHESSGDPTARNPQSSAKGLHQFLDMWDPWFEKNYGKSYSSVVPPKGASPEAKQAAAAEQKQMFDLYYEKEMQPWIARTKASGLGEGLSDVELGALFHRSGPSAAEQYLKTGVDKFEGKSGNGHIAQYMASVAKKYQGNPSYKLASLVAAMPAAEEGDVEPVVEGEAAPAGLSVDKNAADLAFIEGSQPPVPNLENVADEGPVEGGSKQEMSLADAMAKIDSQYDEEKRLTKWEEVAHTLADALTKYAAGTYGAKTGTDVVSHLKMKDKDFGREYSNLLDERNSRQSGALQQEQLRQTASQRDEDRQYKAQQMRLDVMKFFENRDHNSQQIKLAQDKLVVDADQNRLMLQFRQDTEAARLEENQEKRAQRLLEADEKLRNGLSMKVASILQNRKMTPTETMASISATLAPLNVTQDQLRTAFTEPKWYKLWLGDGPKSKEEIASMANEIVRSAPRRSEAEMAGTRVVMPDGTQGVVWTKDQLQEVLRQNGRVVQVNDKVAQQ